MCIRDRKVFRAERVQRGQGDIRFLERVSQKMLMNFTWWLNRKDADGLNVFEGGFLGLDNISVYDRSHALPPGYSLKQADSCLLYTSPPAPWPAR